MEGQREQPSSAWSSHKWEARAQAKQRSGKIGCPHCACTLHVHDPLATLHVHPELLAIWLVEQLSVAGLTVPQVPQVLSSRIQSDTASGASGTVRQSTDCTESG